MHSLEKLLYKVPELLWSSLFIYIGSTGYTLYLEHLHLAVPAWVALFVLLGTFGLWFNGIAFLTSLSIQASSPIWSRILAAIILGAALLSCLDAYQTAVPAIAIAAGITAFTFFGLALVQLRHQGWLIFLAIFFAGGSRVSYKFLGDYQQSICDSLVALAFSIVIIAYKEWRFQRSN